MTSRLEKLEQKIRLKFEELRQSEERYIEINLESIINGYLAQVDTLKLAAKSSYQNLSSNVDSLSPTATIEGETVLPYPDDLMHGKDKIIFGNIRDIYHFQKSTFYPELCECGDDPRRVKELFEKFEKTLKREYGKFCLNKPKSESILSDNYDFFSHLMVCNNFRQPLEAELVTPIQRVMRYQLLLQDIIKCYEKVRDDSDHRLNDGREHPKEIDEDITNLKEAYLKTCGIADYSNNMMLAGRIQGFEGDICAQGLLMFKGKGICYQKRGLFQKDKMRGCQFFIFQESIIICQDDAVLNQNKSLTALISIVASGRRSSSLEVTSSMINENMTSNVPPSSLLAIESDLQYLAYFKTNGVVVREMTREVCVRKSSSRDKNSSCGAEHVDRSGMEFSHVYGFEIERKQGFGREERRSAPSISSGDFQHVSSSGFEFDESGDNPCGVISCSITKISIFCFTEEERDQCLQALNRQIKQLHQMIKRLENP